MKEPKVVTDFPTTGGWGRGRGDYFPKSVTKIETTVVIINYKIATISTKQ